MTSSKKYLTPDNQNNVGFPEVIFPPRFLINFPSDLTRLVEYASRQTWVEFLPDILPSTAKAHSASELAHWLYAGGSHVMIEYGKEMHEAQCHAISALMVRRARDCGIDMYRISGSGHWYGAVRISNPSGGDSREYRFDPTARQYTMQFVGWVVTPRMKYLGIFHNKLYWSPYESERVWDG